MTTMGSCLLRERNGTVTQRKKNLPIGIDNFEKIRKNDFYYVDKSGLITDLLNNWNEVTLFTRPRRFGKTLNMSMLESFFSPITDKSIFDGLKISKEGDLCEKYMGKYPVIFLSLKGIEARDFNSAYDKVHQKIQEIAMNVDMQTRGNEKIHPVQRKKLNKLLQDDIRSAELEFSLYNLSCILEAHYGQKVIILIDEYDVPLAKAHENGYYGEMVSLIRNLFDNALKTNNSLQFAILTGCMRVSKESIFTGLNNLQVRSVSDEEYDEYFGFTDAEVREMLKYYGFPEYYDVVRDWYDGYRFGRTAIYCPWDVICYCRKLCTDSEKSPENYWINSSGNSVVRKFIECSSNARIKNEIEKLVNGGVVEKELRQELTYQDIYASVDNIWSVLFTTGYLTLKERLDGNRFRLVIPNREIRYIYTKQIMELFRENVENDGETLKRICDALQVGDSREVEACFNDYLERTISIRDTFTRKDKKENFYHGILIGILGLKEKWDISSNEESGRGYSDIIIRDTRARLAIVIEVKYEEDDLEAVAERALKQIDEKQYADKLCKGKFDKILKYGIACYQKECRVAVG